MEAAVHLLLGSGHWDMVNWQIGNTETGAQDRDENELLNIKQVA